jgi:TonB family protein
LAQSIRSSSRVQGLTVAVSIGLHLAVSAALVHGRAAGESDTSPISPGQDRTDANATPTHGEAPAVDGTPIEIANEDPVGDVPRVTAGDGVAHLDRGGEGRGGDATSRERAINFADDVDRMVLSPDALSRLDRDQIQRLRVARTRASWEDRRSTTHPGELTLVTTGPGSVRERRPNAPSAPSRGALDSPAPSVEGGKVGAPLSLELYDDANESPGSGAQQAGSDTGAPGTGLLLGRAGTDHRRSAPVGEARPDVTQAAVAVPARDRARPRDDVDSQQEVATTVRSLVLASAAGGLPGTGEGGTAGGGAPGAGAESGTGAVARPLGAGDGDVFDYWTTDPRLVTYFRGIHAKVDPLWRDAFPKSALFELKQGMVILDIVVQRDGSASVVWPPVRPSGVDEFDRNCADAVRRAAPFAPIPPELGLRTLRIRAPFVASNPVVK